MGHITISGSKFMVNIYDPENYDKIFAFFQKTNFSNKKLMDITNQSMQKTKAWFDWKYRSNPYGRAIIFVLENEKEICGFLGVIGLKIKSKNNPSKLIYQLVDGTLAPIVRGKGVFTKFLTECLNSIDNQILGFPNKFIELPILKTGFKIECTLSRWIFPLPGLAKKKFSNKIFITIGDLIASTLHHVFYFNQKNIEICELEKVKKEKVKPLLGENGLDYDFYQWHYAKNPLKSYIARGISYKDRLIGYYVAAINGDCLRIYDFYAKQYIRACLGKIIDLALRLNLYCVEFPSRDYRLYRYGFIRQTGQNVNVITYNSKENLNIKNLTLSDW